MQKKQWPMISQIHPCRNVLTESTDSTAWQNSQHMQTRVVSEHVTGPVLPDGFLQGPAGVEKDLFFCCRSRGKRWGGRRRDF